MRYLEAAAVFRQESENLAEWLGYHRSVGVEHFHLYQNDPPGAEREAALRVLGPWRDAGLVTLRDMPDAKWFFHAFAERALVDLAGAARWTALIDIDEYLAPVGNDSLAGVLRDADADPTCGAVAAFWVVFGSSGHRTRPPTHVRGYTRRAPLSSRHNVSYKCITRLDLAVSASAGGNHFYTLRDGLRIRSAAGATVAGSQARPDHRRLRLHHYMVRSREEFGRKMERGLAGGYTPYDAALETERRWKSFDLNDEKDRLLAARWGEAMEAWLAGGGDPDALPLQPEGEHADRT